MSYPISKTIDNFSVTLAERWNNGSATDDFITASLFIPNLPPYYPSSDLISFLLSHNY